MNKTLTRIMEIRAKYNSQLQNTPDYPGHYHEIRYMLMEFLEDLDRIRRCYRHDVSFYDMIKADDRK
jgi:hypothetical protein